jgi:hypothetical protein
MDRPNIQDIDVDEDNRDSDLDEDPTQLMRREPLGRHREENDFAMPCTRERILQILATPTNIPPWLFRRNHVCSLSFFTQSEHICSLCFQDEIYQKYMRRYGLDGIGRGHIDWPQDLFYGWTPQISCSRNLRPLDALEYMLEYPVNCTRCSQMAWHAITDSRVDCKICESRYQNSYEHIINYFIDLL